MDTDVELKKVGSRVCTLHKEKNMSQTELARESGLNLAPIKRIEEGAKNIRMHTMDAIFTGLAISPRDF